MDSFKLQISYNRVIKLSLLITIFLLTYQNIDAQNQTSSLQRAGLRSSSYGFSSFPDSAWWNNAPKDMAANFGDSIAPAVIWILGYTADGGCHLSFPNPTPGTTYSKITFSSRDKNEKYLTDFDGNGIKVWLQVEPGFADVVTLIDLVLSKYGHHKCVIGFGVDVEWYKTSSSNNNEGEAVTDDEAILWSNEIKTYNSNYLLFTKHWLISKMPPTFRNDIVFIDDSQIFDKMDDMINEFVDWANAFAPAKVGFQYGYDSDKKWWKNLSNPPKDIGNAILKRTTNTAGLYWVDFTAYDIWPEDFNPTSIKRVGKIIPKRFLLKQNFPNPFNPTTTIKYIIPNVAADFSQRITLKVYDILGKEVTTLVNKDQAAGTYTVHFNADGLQSGVYYYRLNTLQFSETKKLIVLK